jgi:hypothetical protein
MANFFQSLFAAIKEPFPSIVCNCLLDAYVHPRDIPVVIQYMRDFTYQDVSLSFGKTDSPDRTHIEVKFKDSEWAPNEIVDSFFIYQDDLQRLVPSGDFVFSIQNHHAVPSFRDIVWEKYRTFLSRWTRHRKKVSRRWKSGRLQKISSAE